MKRRLSSTIISSAIALIGGFGSHIHGQMLGPDWWYEPADLGEVVASTPAASVEENQSVALNGQAKWMAIRAIEQMEALAPGSALGYQGENESEPGYQSLSELYAALTVASSFGNEGNQSIILQGQAKALAQPFYDRFADLGIMPLRPDGVTFTLESSEYPYPWTSDGQDDAHFSPMQLGQLKHLFSFQLDEASWVNSSDADGDGIPDWWENLVPLNYYSITHLSGGEEPIVGQAETITLVLIDQDEAPVEAAELNISLLSGNATLSGTTTTTDANGLSSFTVTPSDGAIVRILIVSAGYRPTALVVTFQGAIAGGSDPTVVGMSSSYLIDPAFLVEGDEEPSAVVLPFMSYVEALANKLGYLTYERAFGEDCDVVFEDYTLTEFEDIDSTEIYTWPTQLSNGTSRVEYRRDSCLYRYMLWGLVYNMPDGNFRHEERLEEVNIEFLTVFKQIRPTIPIHYVERATSALDFYLQSIYGVDDVQEIKYTVEQIQSIDNETSSLTPSHTLQFNEAYCNEGISWSPKLRFPTYEEMTDDGDPNDFEDDMADSDFVEEYYGHIYQYGYSMYPGAWIYGYLAEGYLAGKDNEGEPISQMSLGETASLSFEMPAGFPEESKSIEYIDSLTYPDLIGGSGWSSNWVMHLLGSENTIENFEEYSTSQWMISAEIDSGSSALSLTEMGVTVKLQYYENGVADESDAFDPSLVDKVVDTEASIATAFGVDEDGNPKRYYFGLKFEYNNTIGDLGPFIVSITPRVFGVQHEGNTNVYDLEAARIKVMPNGPGSPPSYSLPVDESAGPRYRKIALNGRPLPDEKPQSEAETDEEPEETYVDAMSLGLRHSVTDVYVPVPNSDLALSVRRNNSPAIWSLKGGLRPHERPDLPFGLGWSTNINPHIHFTLTNISGSSSFPTEPDTATVYDENGEPGQYAIKYPPIPNDFDPTPSSITGLIPMPNGRHEQAAYLNSLVKTGLNVDGNLEFELRKRFGTVVTYEVVTDATWTNIDADRINGSKTKIKHYFARATKVVDRYGNTLVYEYSNTTELNPRIIAYDSNANSDADDEAMRILIGYNGLRINKVVDPRNNVINYAYNTNIGYVVPYFAATTTPVYNGNYDVLNVVTHADNTTTTYTYSPIQIEKDGVYQKHEQLAVANPSYAFDDPGYYNLHLYLSTITDANDSTYTFHYDDQGT
ncbi:hypothetical protein [Cerasicoccus fimbriatus]|uniref:hypothetical protein n=1 Tax=Cerasicoccus fimbriatus TaxID=3014554 RepID=UPI0022B322D3|nr:hypothetical protein [Cerasicoccus sp. TK19100]